MKTMKGAWMTRLQSGFGAGFSQQATPVVQNGVMYVTTGEQEIFALNGKTGRHLGISHASPIPGPAITKPSAASRWARGWCSESSRTSGSLRRPGRPRGSR